MTLSGLLVPVASVLLTAAATQAASAAAAGGGETSPPPAEAAAAISGARQFDITSENGAYRVFVSAPAGPAPATGYPVIYLLDGNSVFGSMVDAARLQAGRIGPAIIVAVGYPIDTPFDGPRRFFDMTPKTNPKFVPAKMKSVQRTGGRDAFLALLLDRVKPLVESRYKVDPERQTLFGHSLGGQFVLHVLFNRPDAFRKYVAGSPSIWWNDRSLLAERDRYLAERQKRGDNNELMVVVGAEELGYIVQDAREMVKSVAPMRVYYKEIEGQEHVSMLPAALNAALGFALDPR
ncbi:alpha/beta hydrolase [Sphingosinicella microcystinivorans]|uniref:alpha/beta hydrolase n=1 Tax=Sphingosinicella microcystinivorans TaxID=335406 RepID=UPI0022F3EC4B|nr:alpha/beta hydrolase-fold protein [Sphingosinicella microcystinivorans]WBX84247.1 alpha/beta hydrolase-fold protein [Sphingosinicella microcystinivorans]